MTAPRKTKKAQPAAETAVETTAEPVEAESTDADGTAAEADPGAPLNRAERRAKGKSGTPSQTFGSGKVTRSHGPAAGPRMWANRRSG